MPFESSDPTTPSVTATAKNSNRVFDTIDEVYEELRQFNATEGLDWNGLSLNLQKSPCDFVAHYWRIKVKEFFQPFEVSMIGHPDAEISTIFAYARVKSIRCVVQPNFSISMVFTFDRPILEMVLSQRPNDRACVSKRFITPTFEVYVESPIALGGRFGWDDAQVV